VSVCLDSWAILAWLDGEDPALSRVENVLASRPVVSWVNLVEVYYRVERDHGRSAADETLASRGASLAPDLPGTARIQGHQRNRRSEVRILSGALLTPRTAFSPRRAAARGRRG